MKHVPLFVAAALAFVLAGCGGGSTISSGSSGTVTTQTRIEAVTKLDPTVVQDPTNFQLSEEYYFELVSYDSAGKRTVLTDGISWASSDTAGTYGTLAGNSGYYVAGSKESPTQLVVQATYGGKLYRANYGIKPRQVRLLGSVVSDADTTKGLDSIVIDFYSLTPVDPNDPTAPRSEVLAATVTTAYDGTFRASVPSDVVRYQIRSESVPDGFFRSYLAPMQDGSMNRFDTGTMDCHPPVPANMPEIGQTQLVQAIQLAAKTAGGTKPDPSACYY